MTDSLRQTIESMIETLPSHIMKPDIDWQDEGFFTVDWTFGRSQMLSLSFREGRTNVIGMSLLDGERSVQTIAAWDGKEMPAKVLVELEHFSKGHLQ